MAVVSKQALDELLSRCRRLKKLSLEHVALDRNICVEIAANKNLEALNLAMCVGIDARSIRQMMTDLKALQSLNISWTHMTFDTLNTFVDCVPSSLLRLNIAGCRKKMTDYRRLNHNNIIFFKLILQFILFRSNSAGATLSISNRIGSIRLYAAHI